MTAEARGDAARDPAGLPSLTLDERQLGDLELLLSGAFAPLTGFMRTADLTAVTEFATLADGTPWPIPVTLEAGEGTVPNGASQLMLADPEGTPLAVLEIIERVEIPAVRTAHQERAARGERIAREERAARGGQTARDERADSADAGDAGDAGPLLRLGGQVSAWREPEHGPFRRLMLTPGQLRAQLGDGPVLAFATRGPLHGRQIGQLRHMAGQLKARLLLLPLVAGPADLVARPEALVRSVLAAAASLPPGTLVVPVPLAARRPDAGTGPDRELAARAAVAAAYGATHLLADPAGLAGGSTVSAGPWHPPAIPVLQAGDWAYDPRAEVWRPLALIEAGTERADLSPGELGDLLDAGAEVPAWFTPDAVARELRRARPPRASRGFVLFLTGLSGSGKSTIARDLRDALAERGDRRVSLLDGDLVRQLLSAGLTFSRADRDLNIARIGYIAAEIARHGGIAICAPIAPYAAARARVREMVSQVGDFLLIHVATPVGVCEARDRKGLYAKARAGLIGQFTGVSDPYEEPEDAELTIDTSAMTRQEAADAVIRLLVSGGWLRAG